MILATTHFNALYLARYFLLEEAGIMGTDNALSYVSPRNIYLLYERKRDRVEYYFNLNTLIKLKQYYQPMANKFNLETTINTCSRKDSKGRCHVTLCIRSPFRCERNKACNSSRVR